ALPVPSTILPPRMTMSCMGRSLRDSRHDAPGEGVEQWLGGWVDCRSTRASRAPLSGVDRAVTLKSRCGDEAMIDVVREPLQVVSFDGHRVGAFLHRPPVTPAPGLVMIPEIFGINLPLREIAARYASEGFVVLVLDIFSRMERDVDLGYDEAGH